MKKVALLVLALVLALGTLGVAYARWSDQVVVKGNVQTNTVKLGFTEFTCQEMYESPVGSGLFFQGEVEGKDVGKVVCSMDTQTLKTDPVTGFEGYGVASIKITNGYPCYWAFATFVVKNLGTTPVRILAWQPVDPTGVLVWNADNMTLDDADGNAVLKFKTENLVGDQLHSGGSDKAEIDVHVEQNANTQGKSFFFDILISAVQWNEYTP